MRINDLGVDNITIVLETTLDNLERAPAIVMEEISDILEQQNTWGLPKLTFGSRNCQYVIKKCSLIRTRKSHL